MAEWLGQSTLILATQSDLIVRRFESCLGLFEFSAVVSGDAVDHHAEWNFQTPLWQMHGVKIEATGWRKHAVLTNSTLSMCGTCGMA